ncbi:MAG: hypothetical protein ACRDBL_07115 [Rhabdaerophilum sp.]
MSRFSRLALAFVAAILMVFTFAPARAAGVPSGSILAIDQAGRIETAQVQYHRRHYRGRHVYHHRGYHHRPVYRHRVYHSRPVYHHRRVYRRHYYAPVYYGRPVHSGRRCFNRVRWVQTYYGPVRRVVRVCRW